MRRSCRPRLLLPLLQRACWPGAPSRDGWYAGCVCWGLPASLRPLPPPLLLRCVACSPGVEGSGASLLPHKLELRRRNGDTPADDVGRLYIATWAAEYDK